MSGFADRLLARGCCVLEQFDGAGKLIDKRVSFNTLTQLHDALMADRISGGSDAVVAYMGIGTGTGGKTTASVALEAQVHRKVLDSISQGSGADDNDVVYICTFAAGEGTGALVEAGLFIGAADNTLQAYQDFAVVNKAAAHNLVFTWTISYGAS